MNIPRRDIKIGDKFNKLTVTQIHPNETYTCQCECGRFRTVTYEQINRIHNCGYSCKAAYTVFGETYNLYDWAQNMKIGVNTIQSRLEYGWGIEDAIGLALGEKPFYTAGPQGTRIISSDRRAGINYYELTCSICGHTYKDVPHAQIKKFRCRCSYKPQTPSKTFVGHKYGKLTVIKITNKKDIDVICECGETKKVSSSYLNHSPAPQCGKCREKVRYKTDHISDRIYHCWYGMHERCYNPRNTNYIYYGGKGIRVCDEWEKTRTGLASFRAWANNNGYAPNLTIDRIDSSKNYEPSNCRWFTRAEQNKTKSHPTRYKKSKLFSYAGELMGIGEISKKTKIPYQKLYRLLVTEHKYNTVEELIAHNPRI